MIILANDSISKPAEYPKEYHFGKTACLTDPF